MGEAEKIRRAVLDRATYFLTGRRTFGGCPYRGYLGLRAYYQMHALDPRGDYRRGIITDELLGFAGVTVEELDKAARKNTLAKRRYQLSPLGGAIEELAGEMDVELGEDLKEAIEEYKKKPFDVYVITSKERTEGADAILYPEILERVAERLRSDIYIWTSSIHEVMVTPKNCIGEDFIHNMVRDINRDVVDDEEVLSDAVYEYVRGSGEVTVKRAASGMEQRSSRRSGQ